MWGCFLMSGVKILHFLKDWWKSIPIHQNYTMALMCIKITESPWTSPFLFQAHDDRMLAWCVWLPWISRSVCAIRRPCWRTVWHKWKRSILFMCVSRSWFVSFLITITVNNIPRLSCSWVILRMTFLCLRTEGAGGIMFPGCPSVRMSVRIFSLTR